ncbi:MAG: TRAP transporter small permease subunit [Gammaproteobacteria bacterium]|nr:TRAP transporter small permease subunit [Gammaproteobacteria bacterium]
MSEHAAAETSAGSEVGTDELRHLSPEEMPFALRLSENLRRFVDWIGRLGSWCILPLVLITAYDVTIRKLFGKQQIWLVENISPFFGSTLLQELEWHFHTALFALVLGYGYVWNTHVRVDLIRENLAFRKQAWLEFIGLTIFLIPYTCIVVYFAFVYAYDSFQLGEISASLVGLSHRWIIKSVLAFGLVVAVIAGIAVWLQVAIALFGPKHHRFPLMTLEWPEETGTMVEGKERLDLEKAEDVLEARAAEQKKKAQELGEFPG